METGRASRFQIQDRQTDATSECHNRSRGGAGEESHFPVCALTLLGRSPPFPVSLFLCSFQAWDTPSPPSPHPHLPSIPGGPQSLGGGAVGTGEPAQLSPAPLALSSLPALSPRSSGAKWMVLCPLSGPQPSLPCRSPASASRMREPMSVRPRTPRAATASRAASSCRVQSPGHPLPCLHSCP